MRPSTESMDDYLKAVFELTAVSERATTSEIARKLKVSAASVTGMLQKLSAATPSMITYKKHFGAELTEAGQRRAVEVIRHHRLIETYLHEALGYRWDEVHEEAEKLEHFISEDLEDRMAEKLGYPEYDPHGHPIPRRDGTIPPCDDIPIRKVAPGSSVRVNRVADENPCALRALAAIGIRPYQEMEVVESVRKDRSITLRRPGEAAIEIDADAAGRIRVVVVGASAPQDNSVRPIAFAGEANALGPEDEPDDGV